MARREDVKMIASFESKLVTITNILNSLATKNTKIHGIFANLIVIQDLEQCSL